MIDHQSVFLNSTFGNSTPSSSGKEQKIESQIPNGSLFLDSKWKSFLRFQMEVFSYLHNHDCHEVLALVNPLDLFPLKQLTNIDGYKCIVAAEEKVISNPVSSLLSFEPYLILNHPNSLLSHLINDG